MDAAAKARIAAIEEGLEKSQILRQAEAAAGLDMSALGVLARDIADWKDQADGSAMVQFHTMTFDLIINGNAGMASIATLLIWLADRHATTAQALLDLDKRIAALEK